ncbi:MAG: hypothetical protein DME04_00420 [Candidatus Rokuibacteriota bacterium]|nr:MAG: hypothetical protein DME04_00420 [Candidatus Rokubacteria bacterium]
MDAFLFSQYLLSGVVIGVIYSLMALGITFIYSVMKMINWGMGEFYMIGSYAQYALIVSFFGPRRWYLALPVAMAGVFVLGVVIQRFLLRPMFVGAIERRDEYATIITIALMVLFRNLAIVLGGPNQYAPADYARPTTIGTLPISGNRFVALIATLVLLGLFYFVIKKTWVGRALRGAAQNRVGIQTAGIDPSASAWRWRPRPARCWRRTSWSTPRTARSRPSRGSRSSSSAGSARCSAASWAACCSA